MSFSPYQELAAKLASAAPDVKRQLRRLVDRLLTRHQLAAKVFLGEDGRPTPAAQEWFARLARDNFIESSTWNGDRDTMLINEGRRKLAIEILSSARLDVERLAALTNLEREL